MDFQLGCAQYDITIDDCHSTINGESEAPVPVRDSLFVRAAIFQTETCRVLMLSYDLIGLTEAWSDQICHALTILGFDRNEVVLACTHTHTAPSTIHFEGHDAPDPKYLAVLQRATCQAVEQALNDLGPVRYGFGQIACPCNINRIERGRLSVVNDMAIEPGHVDDTLSVLAFETKQGCLKWVLWHYAAHPLTLGCMNVLSSDYPGEVTRLLSEHHPSLNTLFLQGCAGNMNPRVNGSPARRDMMAQMLSDGIDQVLAEMSWQQVQTLRFASQAASLRHQSGTSTRILLQAMRLDDLSFSFLPGEQFVELSLELHRQISPTHLAVAYCRKGEIGYVPTERYFREYPQSYECCGSFRSYRARPTDVQASTEIVQRCVAMHRDMKHANLAKNASPFA